MGKVLLWEERKLERRRNPGDDRDEAERDLARLVHSAAFRRLQGKTQILGIGESDFHRTRLTHSMEVAQIGRGIVLNLQRRKVIPTRLLNLDRIVAICLAHDLGHPPFGHGGEIALNCMMRNFGGFEGNGQTLRVLARQEAHTDGHGLNLTRGTLLGILKYPVPYSKVRKLALPPHTDPIKTVARSWKPPKCYHDCESDIVDWILKPLSVNDRRGFQQFKPPSDNENGKPSEKSLDTSIMERADDIAYGVHDLEDSIRLGLITSAHWKRVEPELNDRWRNKYRLRNLSQDLFSEKSSTRKRAIGAIVNALICSTKSEEHRFREPLLRYRIVLEAPAEKFLEALKDLVKREVIHSPEVQTLEYRGQQIVMKLFEAFMSDPNRLLKGAFAQEWRDAGNDQDKARVICDYIAGMTDEHATRVYERLFVPRQGTIFWKF